MAPKMLSECIGKKVTIYIEGGLGGYVATVLAVEDNFIKIEDKKTINVPGVNLNLKFMSEVDKKDIAFAAKHACDYLALSFVNSKEEQNSKTGPLPRISFIGFLPAFCGALQHSE